MHAFDVAQMNLSRSQAIAMHETNLLQQLKGVNIAMAELDREPEVGSVDTLTEQSTETL